MENSIKSCAGFKELYIGLHRESTRKFFTLCSLHLRWNGKSLAFPISVSLHSKSPKEPLNYTPKKQRHQRINLLRKQATVYEKEKIIKPPPNKIYVFNGTNTQ